MSGADPDPTRLVPATAAAGLPGELGALAGVHGDDARTWFDDRLHAFTAALTHDRQGRPRTGIERRALASAARDLVTRIGWAAAAPAPDGASFAPGQLLANTYEVRHLLARGGIAEVYRARHRDLRTDHAVKVLLPRHTLDMLHVTMLINEARLLQSIRHDAVVACHGLLRDSDGRLVLVMEHLRGPTLARRMQDGPLGEAELHALMDRLAAGLAAIHAQGVVHNDLSPDNVILRDDSVPAATLVDFGLARCLAEPTDAQPLLDFAGKFSWVSPERLAGPDMAVDARSDVYSLGLVLAAAARGRRLDLGDDLVSARAARAVSPPLDDLPPSVVARVAPLLRPDPADRPPAAAVLPDAPPPARRWLRWGGRGARRGV